MGALILHAVFIVMHYDKNNSSNEVLSCSIFFGVGKGVLTLLTQFDSTRFIV